MFLSIGLRPFFLLAGLYGGRAMALWLAWIGAGVLPFPAATAETIVAAGVPWVFAFGIFTWVYWPVLTRSPREE